MAEWEVYLHYLEDDMKDIEAGKPINVELTDQDIYEKKMVKAIIAKNKDDMPDGDNLWIKNQREELDPVPWKVKVIEEVGDLLYRTGVRGI